MKEVSMTMQENGVGREWGTLLWIKVTAIRFLGRHHKLQTGCLLQKCVLGSPGGHKSKLKVSHDGTPLQRLRGGEPSLPPPASQGCWQPPPGWWLCHSQSLPPTSFSFSYKDPCHRMQGPPS